MPTRRSPPALRRVLLLIGLALSACGSYPTLQPAEPGLEPAAVQRVFLVSDRVMSASPEDRGERARTLTRAAIDVAIPPSHSPGRIEFDPGAADPAGEFAALGITPFDSEAALLAAISREPNPDEDVVVFVHGFNTSLGGAVYRQAQIARDFGLRGPQVTFDWASAVEPLGYVYDRDSVLVARDHLEGLLLALGRGDRRIVIVAHSMGGHLVTETLRQMSLGGEDWIVPRLSAVVLLSPDIDVDVFRSQVARIDPMPEPFVVVVSRRDRVLRLSARLTGQQERLGSTSDMAALQALGVSVVDLTSLSGSGGNGHLLAATSPAAIAVLRGLMASEPDFGREDASILDVADIVVQDLLRPVLGP